MLLINPLIFGTFPGAETQNRTADTGIFSPLLYRLSYLGMRCSLSLGQTEPVVKGICRPIYPNPGLGPGPASQAPCCFGLLFRRAWVTAR